MSEAYSFLFGPVPSRRLGLSLGVDLVPPKTCSLDCVYCESGKTTRLTTERKEWVDTDKVISELENYLSLKPDIDVVTFSGAGEPVLNTSIPVIVNFLKTNFPEYRTVLLTNGTLFSMEQARRDVMDIDLVIASVDAVSPEVFKAVNRPHPSLDPDSMIKGLSDFRKEYIKEFWLEIFIVPGLNDKDSELGLLASAVKRIQPDRIQINSLDRPGTEAWVRRVDQKDLERIYTYFDSVEIAGRGKCRATAMVLDEKMLDEVVLKLVQRRPCTEEDIVKSLGIDGEKVRAAVASLIKCGKIQSVILNQGVFFRTV